MSHCRPIFTALALLLLTCCLQCSKTEVGQPCNLGFDAGQSQVAYNPQAPECSTGLCLKPALEEYAANRETSPYCSTTCSSDSDCDGPKRSRDDPDDRRCSSGFACGVAFTVGPLCCKKVCLCKDFLSAKGVATPPSCLPGSNGRTACEDR